MKIRTLIVDDELLARERLRQLLRQQPEIEIVGECSNGREAVAAIQEEAAGAHLSRCPDARVGRLRVLEAIRAGRRP